MSPPRPRTAKSSPLTGAFLLDADAFVHAGRPAAPSVHPKATVLPAIPECLVEEVAAAQPSSASFHHTPLYRPKPSWITLEPIADD